MKSGYREDGPASGRGHVGKNCDCAMTGALPCKPASFGVIATTQGPDGGDRSTFITPAHCNGRHPWESPRSSTPHRHNQIHSNQQVTNEREREGRTQTSRTPKLSVGTPARSHVGGTLRCDAPSTKLTRVEVPPCLRCHTHIAWLWPLAIQGCSLWHPGVRSPTLALPMPPLWVLPSPALHVLLLCAARPHARGPPHQLRPGRWAAP